MAFFLEEDLDKAIGEWETVLLINPNHEQAKKDLANAKGLQAIASALVHRVALHSAG